MLTVPGHGEMASDWGAGDVEFQYVVGAQTFKVEVERVGETYRVRVNDRVYVVATAPTSGRTGELSLIVDDARHLAWVASDGAKRWVVLDGAAEAPVELLVPPPDSARRRGAKVGDAALEAEMPGVVRRVLVAEGEVVERGQVLLLLEAMKMEIRVSAPRAGVVGKVGVTEGQAVERGTVLVALVSGAS
jgi:biotin carboxyl carrier protein